jgi:hypothetical protein
LRSIPLVRTSTDDGYVTSEIHVPISIYVYRSRNSVLTKHRESSMSAAIWMRTMIGLFVVAVGARSSD